MALFLPPHVVQGLCSPVGASHKVPPCCLSSWVLDFLAGSSSFPEVRQWRQLELLQGQHDFHHVLLVKVSQVRFIVLDCARGPQKGMNSRRHGSWRPSFQTDYHRISEKGCVGLNPWCLGHGLTSWNHHVVGLWKTWSPQLLVSKQNCLISDGHKYH